MKIFLKLEWRVKLIHQNYQGLSLQKVYKVLRLKVKMCKTSLKNHKKQVPRKKPFQITLLV